MWLTYKCLTRNFYFIYIIKSLFSPWKVENKNFISCHSTHFAHISVYYFLKNKFRFVKFSMVIRKNIFCYFWIVSMNKNEGKNDDKREKSMKNCLIFILCLFLTQKCILSVHSNVTWKIYSVFIHFASQSSAISMQKYMSPNSDLKKNCKNSERKCEIVKLNHLLFGGIYI
jgi:hypothetical protein